MKVAFYTLGCKVNQNETGAMQQLFCENGFTLAQGDETADVYIVNSCTVTSGGDKKSRQWLRRAKRTNPEAVTVLTGCFPQAFEQEARAVTEADIITGSAARKQLVAHVLRFIQTRERIIDIVPHSKEEAFEELPMEQMAGHTRAFMKIEDGCNRRCAYCVIPRARGFVRSRREENILRELEILGKAGYREVVFSGINLSSYGTDTGTTLEALTQKAALVPGIERIRLGSLEPDLCTDAFIEALAEVPAFCPQFHLSLQSGCTKTLRAMRRIYTAEEYKDVVRKIRRAIPDAVFTTDVIVGFPGETEEDFAESLRFVEKIGFLKVHVFTYSSRPGTPAAEMPGHLSEAEKLSRNHRLQQAADAVRARIIGEMEGQEDVVLTETPIAKDTYTGYTRRYVPVVVKAPGVSQGMLVPVRLGAWDAEKVRCEAIPLL